MIMKKKRLGVVLYFIAHGVCLVPKWYYIYHHLSSLVDLGPHCCSFSFPTLPGNLPPWVFGKRHDRFRPAIPLGGSLAHARQLEGVVESECVRWNDAAEKVLKRSSSRQSA